MTGAVQSVTPPPFHVGRSSDEEALTPVAKHHRRDHMEEDADENCTSDRLPPGGNGGGGTSGEDVADGKGSHESSPTAPLVFFQPVGSQFLSSSFSLSLPAGSLSPSSRPHRPTPTDDDNENENDDDYDDNCDDGQNKVDGNSQVRHSAFQGRDNNARNTPSDSMLASSISVASISSSSPASRRTPAPNTPGLAPLPPTDEDFDEEPVVRHDFVGCSFPPLALAPTAVAPVLALAAADDDDENENDDDAGDEDEEDVVDESDSHFADAQQQTEADAEADAAAVAALFEVLKGPFVFLGDAKRILKSDDELSSARSLAQSDDDSRQVELQQQQVVVGRQERQQQQQQQRQAINPFLLQENGSSSSSSDSRSSSSSSSSSSSASTRRISSAGLLVGCALVDRCLEVVDPLLHQALREACGREKTCVGKTTAATADDISDNANADISHHQHCLLLDAHSSSSSSSPPFGGFSSFSSSFSSSAVTAKDVADAMDAEVAEEEKGGGLSSSSSSLIAEGAYVLPLLSTLFAHRKPLPQVLLLWDAIVAAGTYLAVPLAVATVLLLKPKTTAATSASLSLEKQEPKKQQQEEQEQGRLRSEESRCEVEDGHDDSRNNDYTTTSLNAFTNTSSSSSSSSSSASRSTCHDHLLQQLLNPHLLPPLDAGLLLRVALDVVVPNLPPPLLAEIVLHFTTPTATTAPTTTTIATTSSLSSGQPQLTTSFLSSPDTPPPPLNPAHVAAAAFQAVEFAKQKPRDGGGDKDGGARGSFLIGGDCGRAGDVVNEGDDSVQANSSSSNISDTKTRSCLGCGVDIGKGARGSGTSVRGRGGTLVHVPLLKYDQRQVPQEGDGLGAEESKAASAAAVGRGERKMRVVDAVRSPGLSPRLNLPLEPHPQSPRWLHAQATSSPPMASSPLVIQTCHRRAGDDADQGAAQRCRLNNSSSPSPPASAAVAAMPLLNLEALKTTSGGGRSGGGSRSGNTGSGGAGGAGNNLNSPAVSWGARESFDSTAGAWSLTPSDLSSARTSWPTPRTNLLDTD
jgi:hypothetical protein